MKGICFKEPLFRKTVQGVKTQTRRIVAFPRNAYGGLQAQSQDGVIVRILALDEHERSWRKDGSEWLMKPKYKLGEILYLKEPYAEMPFGGYDYAFDPKTIGLPWKNKLFMPASAARYFIKITGVRAERLQDITEEDCFREGIQDCDYGGMQCVIYGLEKGLFFEELGTTPIKAYAALIDKINGKGTWDSNPFVWVYDYEMTNND